MAVITNSVIGIPSGKLGNLVIKNRNGKTIASVYVSEIKACKSDASVQNRSSFAVTVKLALSVNSVSVLKDIWNTSKAEGSNAYQKLIKNNAKLSKQGSLTTSNIITPEGLALKLESASFENKNLHLSFVCPSNRYLKYPALLFVYMYFEKENKSIIPLFAALEETSPDGSYDIELTLDSRVRKIFSRDPDPIIYIALAGGTQYKKRVYWTSTASLQM